MYEPGVEVNSFVLKREIEEFKDLDYKILDKIAELINQVGYLKKEGFTKKELETQVDDLNYYMDKASEEITKLKNKKEITAHDLEKIEYWL